MTKRNQTVVHYAEAEDSDDETEFITLKRKRKRAKEKVYTLHCLHAYKLLLIFVL